MFPYGVALVLRVATISQWIFKPVVHTDLRTFLLLSHVRLALCLLSFDPFLIFVSLLDFYDACRDDGLSDIQGLLSQLEQLGVDLHHLCQELILPS